MPRPALAGTPAPRRRSRVRRVGQFGDYVEDEDAPSAAQVVALGEALEAAVAPWGRLALEIAANCGPRWGEQFQLTANDARPDGCAPAQGRGWSRESPATGRPELADASGLSRPSCRRMVKK